jgi:hypothetical protein
MGKWSFACLAASILMLPGAARAQGLDLTGSWAIQMMTFVPEGTRSAAVAAGCAFQGTANVTQTGSQLSGDMFVHVTSGGTNCPPSMSATLSGDVTGNRVDMGVAVGGGTLGQASFVGTATAAVANGPSTMSGTFSATSGPFTGTNGTWSATRLAPATSVPTLDVKGLALLAVLLLGTAIWLLWRRAALRGN